MAVIFKDCYQYQVKKTNTNLKKCCFAPHLSQEQPKKVCFKYDLVFNPECELPVDHLRCEKLTFNNPSKDFKRKLIKAGGVRLPDNMTDCIQSTTMWCTVILILILIFGVYTVLTVWQCLKDSWWKNLIYFLISDNSCPGLSETAKQLGSDCQMPPVKKIKTSHMSEVRWHVNINLLLQTL